MDAKTLGDAPALPCAADGGCGPCRGMTLRQHFAGLAMQGYIATGETWIANEQRVALASLKHADALLAELAKEQNK